MSLAVFAQDRTWTAAGLRERAVGLSTHRARPFSAPALGVLQYISKRLLMPGQAAPFVALGYWLRPAALEEYRKAFEQGLPKNAVAVPRGLAFHLPPANVDTIFIYSWALSLLVGNSNLVRLPSVVSEPMQRLLNDIEEAMRDSPLGGANLFTSYPVDEALTRAVSEVADLRIIWGGDSKVQSISALPQKPRAVTVGFPDRYSYSAISIASYEALSHEERDALADRAFSDIYLFDQMACSSSRIFVWVGGEGDWRRASADFSRRIGEVARRRQYDTPGNVIVAKFAFANRAAIEADVEHVDFSDSLLTSVYLSAISDVRELQQGGGAMFHANVERLADLQGFVAEKDQTLTYFGFDRDELVEFVNETTGRGLDRVIPIGKALQFDRVWDGLDLLRTFSRLTVVS